MKLAKETEWKLKDEVFRDIVGVFGMPDIFLLLVLMQNGTASPAMGKDFSGSRSLIREALRSGSVSEEVLQICLACGGVIENLKVWIYFQPPFQKYLHFLLCTFKMEHLLRH